MEDRVRMSGVIAGEQSGVVRALDRMYTATADDRQGGIQIVDYVSFPTFVTLGDSGSPIFKTVSSSNAKIGGIVVGRVVIDDTNGIPRTLAVVTPWDTLSTHLGLSPIR